MKENDNLIRWNEAVMRCKMHYERMIFASNSLNKYFPLDEKVYENWTAETIALADQMIYRFSKLQDTIGGKLFKLILILKAEDIQGLAFKDILLKLEQLQIIDNAETWLKLRETRNIVTHEYPESTSEIVEGLNILKKDILIISDIYNKLRNIEF